MKKTLSLLLAASMLLAIAPMTVSAYDTGKISETETKLQEGDLALGKDVIYSTAIPEGANGDWAPSKLIDGSLNYNGKETTGFHSQHSAFGGDTGVIGKNHSEWAGVDFGVPTTFDTLVIYPNQPEANRGLTVCPSFPNAFRVEVSGDNIDWKTLTISVNGDDENAAETIYDFEPPAAEPVTINFSAVTARYVRFVGVSLNYLIDGFYLKISELAVYNTGYKPKGYPYSENILEGKAPTFTEGGTYNGANDGWYPNGVGLTDGDRYNMNTNTANNDYGQFTGFHSALNASSLDFYYDLGAGSTLNQLVLYPSTEKHSSYQRFPIVDGDKVGDASGEHLGIYLPNAIHFYVSDNATNWTEVGFKDGFSYSKESCSAEYKPIVFDLDKVYTATYLRVAFDVPGSVKLSELEAYDTTKVLTAKPDEGQKETVVNENADFAQGAKVIYSGITPATNWDPSNLNNGKVESDGGFTTNNGGTNTAARLWVGYDLGAPTRINTVVLYSSGSTDERDAEWSGIPKTFEIQVSSDMINWQTVRTVTNETVPAKTAPCSYSFEDQDAQYVRILATESYPKGSDGENCYIQLAEMQVLNSVRTGKLTENGTNGTITTQGVGAWTSVRTGADGKFDMRFLLASANDTVRTGDKVTVEFRLADGSVKSVSRTVSTAAGANQMNLYTQVSAAGVVYTAEDCSMFGCVITGIPENGFVTATVRVSRNGLIVLPDVSVDYSNLWN